MLALGLPWVLDHWSLVIYESYTPVAPKMKVCCGPKSLIINKCCGVDGSSPSCAWSFDVRRLPRHPVSGFMLDIQCSIHLSSYSWLCSDMPAYARVCSRMLGFLFFPGNSFFWGRNSSTKNPVLTKRSQIFCDKYGDSAFFRKKRTQIEPNTKPNFGACAPS